MVIQTRMAEVGARLCSVDWGHRLHGKEQVSGEPPLSASLLLAPSDQLPRVPAGTTFLT